MKVQYVADDGTAFSSERECKNYEQSQAFGADVRFVNAVATALNTLLKTSDRGYGVIEFDDDDEQTKVAIAIAKNFEKLSEVYETIAAARTPGKVANPNKNKKPVSARAVVNAALKTARK
jgi:hypothetical protein